MNRLLGGLVCATLAHAVVGLQLDNGVVGTPQVRCEENSITFSVRSQNLFRGNIYIKNQYGVPQCRQQYTTNDFNGASFTVRINDCGMRRIRQLQPTGMNFMLVFVVNFHPQFVTKVDRAYNVRCFYAQSDKQVTSQLEVSMLTTLGLEQATMLMPNCEYSVRQGSINGPRVRYAKVGDQLIHRWECDNPNYGMLIKNCFVNDGSGGSVRVLDNRGCPVFTPVIQGPLQYDNSLNMAYVEIWAYKFPDRSQLFFQCQIQICNKRDNECVGVTPPNCPSVTKDNFQAGSIFDASTDPNRVTGTFGPGVQVNPAGNTQLGGNFVVDGNNQVSPIRPVVVAPQTDGYSAGNTVGIGASNDNNYNAVQSPFIGSNVDGGDGYGVQPALGFQSGVQSSGVQGTSFTDPNSNLLPVRPYNYRARDTAALLRDLKRIRQRRRKRNMEIAVMRYVRELPASSATSMMHDEPIDDMETLDVVSDPVYVADAGDDEDPDDPGYTHFPFTSESRMAAAARASAAVCLNPAGVTLIAGAGSLLFTCLLAALGYIYVLWRRDATKLILDDRCETATTVSGSTASTPTRRPAHGGHAPSTAKSTQPLSKAFQIVR